LTVCEDLHFGQFGFIIYLLE